MFKVQRYSFFRNIDSGQTIRLTAGQAGVHAGFLEIIPFRGGRWQLVCNDDFSWNKQAADVACRQMGYDSANIFEIGQNKFADFRKIDSKTKIPRIPLHFIDFWPIFSGSKHNLTTF